MTDTPTAEHWQIALENMGLIWRHVNRLPAFAREDAAQDAVFGLVRAAQKYDPAKGFKFATYANWHIRNAIVDGRERTLTRSDRRAIRSGQDVASVVSLDAPAGDDTTATLGDTIADTDTPHDITDIEVMWQRAVAYVEAGGVHPHDRVILAALPEWDLGSQVEVAGVLGVSGERVRQRRVALIGRLRGSGLLDV